MEIFRSKIMIRMIFLTAAIMLTPTFGSTKREVLDAFMYNGEIDILLLRLHVLNSTVLFFVLAESKCTFSSLPKPLYFYDRDRNHPAMQEFLPRIVHVAAQQECTSATAKHDPWEMEKDLRNVVIRGIPTNISLSALVMLSDIDEFPSPQALDHARDITSACQTGFACHFDSTMYYYDLSHRVLSEKWYHPQLLTLEDVRSNTWTPQEIRDIGFELSRSTAALHLHHVIIDGGWHLSFFGTDQDRIRKIQSFSHQEYNKPEVVNRLKLQRDQGMDPLGRSWQQLQAQPCNLSTLPSPVVTLPHLFGYLAPHCPTSRTACHQHLPYFNNGILTFSSSKDYINGGFGGGVTNQVVGLKNGLLIAHATQLPIQLPDAYTRESWSDRQKVWRYKTINFNTLFSEQDLLSDTVLNSKVCILTKQEAQSLLGINSLKASKNRATINVLHEVNKHNWRFMDSQVLRDIIQKSVRDAKFDSQSDVAELWLGATSDLIWAKNKSTEQLSNHILTTIRFAPDIERVGKIIVATLRSVNLGFTALHLRIDEHDSSAFATQSHSKMLQSVIQLLEYDSAAPAAPSPKQKSLLYVASGNHATSLLEQLPYPATRKELLFPDMLLKMSRFPEMMGAVDFVVCEKSDHFIGFSQSTFSSLLVLRRHYQGQSAVFYDAKNPPWQISLSLDPKGARFRKLTSNNNQCSALHVGKRADCEFIN